MERTSSKPTASIPMSRKGCSETIAADRFVAKEQVGSADILASHWTQTQRRMSARAVVLCFWNTTELDFHGQQIDGLGPLNSEARSVVLPHLFRPHLPSLGGRAPLT